MGVGSTLSIPFALTSGWAKMARLQGGLVGHLPTTAPVLSVEGAWEMVEDGQREAVAKANREPQCSGLILPQRGLYTLRRFTTALVGHMGHRAYQGGTLATHFRHNAPSQLRFAHTRICCFQGRCVLCDPAGAHHAQCCAASDAWRQPLTAGAYPRF